MVHNSNKLPHSVKASTQSNSSKGPQPRGSTNTTRYHLRDAVAMQTWTRVSELAQAVKCHTGDTRISGCIPQALTTALEGLSKQEMWKCRSWQMNGMGRPLDEKRESKYLLPPDSLLQFSSLPCIRNSAASEVIKAFLADIRGNGCPSFHDGGIHGQDENPIVPCE